MRDCEVSVNEACESRYTGSVEVGIGNLKIGIGVFQKYNGN